MQNKPQTSSLRFWLLLTGLIGAAVLTRIVPHPENFAPIAAIALFGGAHFLDRRKAFLVPLAAMLVSDVVLYAGKYQSWLSESVSTCLLVYVAFALIVCMGMWLQKRKSVLNVAGACLGGSFLFFLITNFGVWLGFDMYSDTLDGLISCYVAGIPFYKNTLLADVLFTGVLFGGFALLESQVPQLREARELLHSDAQVLAN